MFKNPLSIASILIILLGIFGIVSQINRKNDYIHGAVVFVKIVDKELDCERSSKYNRIKVQYDNQIFVMGTNGHCKELQNLENEMLQVKISQDKKNIFFIDELDNFSEQIAASSLILAVGLFCLMKSK